jgi:hypothetical protein
MILSQAAHLLAPYAEYGLCETDPRVVDEINKAIERLLPRLNPEKSIVRYQLDIYQQVITMPRDVKTVLAASTMYPSCAGNASTPPASGPQPWPIPPSRAQGPCLSSCGPGCGSILAVKNAWYEMLPGGPVGFVPCAQNVLMDLGTGFSTFADPTPLTPYTLRLYADVPQATSEGFIVINGTDVNGNNPISYENNIYIPGQVLAIPTASSPSPSVTFTAATNSGSPVVTAASTPVGLVETMSITGPGIPAGSTIVTISGTSITISNNATATAASVSLTATGGPPSALPYNDTPQMFQGIISITKPKTAGRLRLYGVDATGAQTPLALWEPDELNPDYRRYLVTFVGNPPPSFLTVLAKRRYIYTTSPYADLMITNIGALENALMARKYEKAGAFDQATAAWRTAFDILDTETRDFDGDYTAAPQFQTQFTGGDIWNLR